ncbi:hypothetical protein SALBM135S_02409 [Streptomyces alboniger]
MPDTGAKDTAAAEQVYVLSARTPRHCGTPRSGSPTTCRTRTFPRATSRTPCRGAATR